MYKDRIKKWGLDKKNKERDMLAIVRKKTEREAIGKESSFRVRGRIVTMENVLHYFKRKNGMQKMGIPAAATPSDISCWTPSPVHTPRPIDAGTQTISADYSSSESYFNTFLPLAPANNDVDTRMVGKGWTPAPPFVDDEYINQLTINDIYNFLSDREMIPRSPSPPQTLLVPEYLLFSIKTYFHGSFESGTWITDKNGYCTTINPADTSLPDKRPQDFRTYSILAAQLVKQGSSADFRRVLSKAFSLVEDLRERSSREL
jgi:hypothetical protein